MKPHLALYALLAGVCLMTGTSHAARVAVTKTFTIREPFGLSWGPDRVNYRVEFPEGQVAANRLALTDAVETVLGGNGLRVTFPDGRVDTVVAMAQPGTVEVEGRQLTGPAFVVTRAAGGTVTVTDLAH